MFTTETLIWYSWGGVRENIILGARIVSELKCCKRCGAFLTCTTKGECCPECEYFDPVDNVCMAIPVRKKEKQARDGEPEEIDPDTYLFEDDDEDEDLSDLPPERNSDDDEIDDDEIDDDEDFDFEDDDW